MNYKHKTEDRDTHENRYSHYRMDMVNLCTLTLKIINIYVTNTRVYQT